VGGGHAQIAPPLIDAGYQVTVAGSAPVCGARLEPWTSTGRCRFDVADLQHLPYEDATFDAVVCYRLLVRDEQPQFLLPMALHRLTRSATFARAAEWPGRRTGITRVLGSPVIVRADRRPQD
jgi:hypothetical protein